MISLLIEKCLQVYMVLAVKTINTTVYYIIYYLVVYNSITQQQNSWVNNINTLNTRVKCYKIIDFEIKI